MTDNLTITSERVDDIPVLIGHLQRMQVARLMEQYYPTRGHWRGLSLGKVAWSG